MEIIDRPRSPPVSYQYHFALNVDFRFVILWPKVQFFEERFEDFFQEGTQLTTWAFVPQAKVQEYYKQMNDLVTETYSEEDQQIIGCPSIQQVRLRTVFKLRTYQPFQPQRGSV